MAALVHVIRILGKTKDKNGEKVDVPDTYIDVQRSNTMIFEEGSGFDYQKMNLELNHYDDSSPDERKPNPNPVRENIVVKIIPPDEDKDDPQLWFEVDAVKELTLQDVDQRIVRLFDNSKDNETRRKHVRIRRIFHYDTPYDDDPALAEGGIIYTRQGAIVRDYQKITEPDTKDSGQYLDVEVIETYEFDDYRPEKNKPPKEYLQRAVVQLDTEFLMDNSEDPKDPPKSYEPGDVNPPWRLDPYQNIINVQYSPPQEVMVAWGNGFYATSTSSKNTRDGKKYDDGFGSNVTTAASGLGVTVVPSAPDMVVFGKPRDGEACFIIITPKFDGSGKDIRRGVSDKKGGIKWSKVQSAADASGTVAVSFAGGAFFVASNDGDSRSFLYVSFDGENWQKVATADNPNNGEDGLNGNPEGNHVAYNPDTKVYCHTGWFSRGYEYDLIDIDTATRHPTFARSVNFWSATSKDGLIWKPKYDTSQFDAGSGGPTTKTGNQGSPGSLYNSVAFGAGLFVAPSSWAIEYDYFNFNGLRNTNQHVISRIDTVGVAVSEDGIKWSNMQLPDVHWDAGIFNPGPHGEPQDTRTAITGLATGIIWCKTGGTDPDTKKPKGFFLLTATEEAFGTNPPVPIYHKKRWTSSNGREWKLAYSSDDQSQNLDNALSVHNKNYNPKNIVPGG